MTRSKSTTMISPKGIWFSKGVSIIAFFVFCILLQTCAFSQDSQIASSLEATLRDQISSGSTPLVPTARERTISKNVEILLKGAHLSKKPTDETLSERAFDLYFKALDPRKVYFYQSDVDAFAQRRKEIGAMVTTGDVSFAFEVYNRYLKRIDERIVTVLDLLNQPIDLNTDEEIITDRKAMTYPKTPEEARARWEKQIKYDILSLKAEEQDKAIEKAEKEAKDAAKENGDAPAAPVPMPVVSQDMDAFKKKLKRRYIFYNKRMHQTSNDDLLEIFLTSVANSYDPHTSYMSPSSFENFMIQMRLNLDGIGATLQSIDGLTAVKKLVSKGPAAKGGELKVDDQIVAVGQGPNGKMDDVYDMKLNDVVAKIRGKGGTVVRLEVVDPADVDKYAEYKEEGKPKPPTRIISIVRERVQLDDQAAQWKVFEFGKKPDQTPYKIGVIDLPSFYFDSDALRRGDPNFRSSRGDIQRYLRQFVKDNVDAVVIDLRDNGGGSLQEVVGVTGLFIETGNVVMTKDIGQRSTPLDDRDPSVDWTGPLVVIVNKLSASASEIFAGAIKDYHRGLILGDSTTHGKGSVQELKDIGDLLFRGNPNPPDWGALKLTVSGYYLPSGVSPQLNGVTSDVELPSLTNCLEDISEKDLDYPLSFEKIPANPKCPNFPYVNETIIKEVRDKSAPRIQADPDFQKTLRENQLYLEFKAKKARTLNEKKFFEEHERLRAEKMESDRFDEIMSGENQIKRDYYLNEIMAETVDYIQALNGAGIAFPKERAIKAGGFGSIFGI